jgi:hypothetical protein
MQLAALLAALHHFSQICQASTPVPGSDEQNDIHAFTLDNLWPGAVVPYRYVSAVRRYCPLSTSVSTHPMHNGHRA